MFFINQTKQTQRNIEPEYFYVYFQNWIRGVNSIVLFKKVLLLYEWPGSQNQPNTAQLVFLDILEFSFRKIQNALVTPQNSEPIESNK